MADTRNLPDGFEALEGFVDEWVLPDSAARSDKRYRTEFSEIERFYDAVIALAPEALAELAQRQLGTLDPSWERLLKLLLALAEIGPSVEWFRQAGVVDGLPYTRFRPTLQLSDTDSQDGGAPHGR